ncbi:MAG: hypothetical protein IIC13_19570, partial [SAR324 cluster bacterium]|nr:hypothetical protein [SAR324 cluster bacterium]
KSLRDSVLATGREKMTGGGAETDFIRLEITDPDLCGRYTATLIEGIIVRPSPFWLQQRLIHAGLRPINAVVDATNYVMLELGQPLHAFDHATLRPEGGGGWRWQWRRQWRRQSGRQGRRAPDPRAPGP